MSRFELLDEIDLPFPLGGAFGYWGYDLKNFTEPKLPRRAVNDLELPDCHVGFYDSLVVFDHRLGKVCIVSTGLNADGSRSEARAKANWIFGIQKLRKRNCHRDTETQRKKKNPILCASVPLWLKFLPIFPATILFPQSSARKNTSAPATFIRSTFRSGSRRNAIYPAGNFLKNCPPFRPRRFPRFWIAANLKSPRRRRNNFCA